MRIAVTSVPNFGTKFGWRWLRHRRVGPLGLLTMTTVFCHSEASAHTDRGNPSFLRWTVVRAAEVVGPYAPRGTGERHAGVVVPYGWLRRVAAIARASGAQRSVCGAVARGG